MKYSEALGRSVIPVFGGLILGGYLGSVSFALALFAADNAPFIKWLTSPALAFGLFLFAMIFAAPTVFFVGWPAYALLLYLNRAKYLWSALIPMVLSAVALLAGEPELSALTVLYGLSIAWVTHSLQMRSNCAFNPVAEQALRQNQTIVPQRVIAALGGIGQP